MTSGVATKSAASFVLLVLAAHVGCKPSDEKEWIVDEPIGIYPSRRAAETAAVEKLSDVLVAKPHVEVVRFRWRLTSGNFPNRERATLYIRRSKILAYEDEPGSGESESWHDTDEAVVRKLAAKGGCLEDLGPPKPVGRSGAQADTRAAESKRD